MTDLRLHVRGDTFRYSFTLGNGWVGTDFTGGLKFTLRTTLPASSVVSDSDAVDQASVAAGEILMSGASGTVTIPASRAYDWPTGTLVWDLQGTVTAVPDNIVYTIDRGSIRVVGDVTRS